jgi:hypothetical protein
MPLMAHQEIGMLEIEQRQLTERLLTEVEPALAKENNKRNRKAKQDITERLSLIARRHKELDALLDRAAKEAYEGLLLCQKADAERAAKAAEKEAGNLKRMLSKPHALILECQDCQGQFQFSVRDQRVFTENGWLAPVRCSDCRAAKKAARPQPLSIECCDCHKNFEFSVGSQRYFEEQGWETPVRCSDCRAAKKAAAPKPVLINCAKCRADFSFSVGAQKHFKQQGWSDPVRCKKCREEHKSETASRASSHRTGH